MKIGLTHNQILETNLALYKPKENKIMMLKGLAHRLKINEDSNK